MTSFAEGFPHIVHIYIFIFLARINRAVLEESRRDRDTPLPFPAVRVYPFFMLSRGQSALFNMVDLLTVLLLLICICTYVRGFRKGIFDVEDGSHSGLRGDRAQHPNVELCLYSCALLDAPVQQVSFRAFMRDFELAWSTNENLCGTSPMNGVRSLCLYTVYNWLWR